MKSFSFHLMPYTALDLSFAEQYDSALGDAAELLFRCQDRPVSLRALYQRIGSRRRAGFDGICVNEHHRDRLRPDAGAEPDCRGAHADAPRAKIAVLGRALPLVHSPVAIAEELAMLDQISGGRLIAGFVRGIGSKISPTPSTRRTRTRASMKHTTWSCGHGSTGPFAVPRSALRVRIRQPLAQALATTAPADLAAVARLQRDGGMGCGAGAQVHLPADLQPAADGQEGVRLLSRGGGALGLHRTAVTARLGSADVCRRDRRDRQARGKAAHRGVLHHSSCACGWRCGCLRLFVSRLDQGDRSRTVTKCAPLPPPSMP